MFTWLKNLLGVGEASGKRARNAKGRFVADNPDAQADLRLFDQLTNTHSQEDENV